MSQFVDIKERLSSEKCTVEFSRIDELETKLDPETRPFDSKYEARELLLALRDLVSIALGEEGCDDTDRVRIERLGLRVALRIASNLCATEENSAAESYLQLLASIADTEWFNELKVAKKLGNPVPPDAKFNEFRSAMTRKSTPLCSQAGNRIAMAAYKDLGALWAGREEGDEKSCEMLGRGVHMYEVLQQSLAQNQEESSDEGANLDMTAVDPNWNEDACLTYLYYYLGQTWVRKDPIVAARYLMKTLRRQRTMKHETYEPTRWTRDVMGLSSLFLSQMLYDRAVECAFAAEQTAKEVVETAKQASFSVVDGDSGDDNDVENQMEDAIDLINEVHMHIASIYANLLRDSTVAHFQSENQVEDLSQVDDEPGSIFSDSATVEKLPTPLEIRNGPHSDRVALFKKANHRLETAVKHFVLDGYVSQYVNIRMTQSNLYGDLAKFETDCKKIAAMSLRRIELFGDLLESLNPTVYVVELQEISYEIGAASFSLLEAQLQRSQAAKKKLNKLRPADVKRVNSAAISTIEHFSKFIDVVNTKAEDFADNLASTYVLAHANIAHAYNKMISDDVQQVIACQTASMTKYEEAIRLYHELVPEDKKHTLAEHISLASELVTLIPPKIAVLQRDGLGALKD